MLKWCLETRPKVYVWRHRLNSAILVIAEREKKMRRTRTRPFPTRRKWGYASVPWVYNPMTKIRGNVLGGGGKKKVKRSEIGTSNADLMSAVV